jgi:hypothetical protein
VEGVSRTYKAGQAVVEPMNSPCKLIVMIGEEGKPNSVAVE